MGKAEISFGLFVTKDSKHSGDYQEPSRDLATIHLDTSVLNFGPSINCRVNKSCRPCVVIMTHGHKSAPSPRQRHLL